MMRPRWTGASIWQRFWLVTLPLLGHTLDFGQCSDRDARFAGIHPGCGHALTSGWAGQCHLRYELARIQRSLHNLRFGFATATAFTLFIFVFVITVVQLRGSAAKLELLNAIGRRWREAASLNQ